MTLSALKSLFTLVFSGLTIIALGQEFDSTNYADRDRLIDTLLADEKYEAVIPIFENQINYLKKVNRIDSLGQYIYDLGHAYLVAKGPSAAIVRTAKFVNWFEAHQEDKSQVLRAVSDLSWIYFEAGKDSLCYEADLRYFTICENYPGATASEKSQAHYALGFDFQVLFGNAKKAIYHFQEALNAVLKDSLKYKERVLDSMNALGAAYFRNGSMRDSRKILKRALHFSNVLPDSMAKWSQQANIYGNLALGYQDDGNLVKSKDYLYKSMAMRKQMLDSLDSGYQRDQQRRLLINNYSNLAALNLAIGDVSKAYTVTQYTAKLRKKWLVAGHTDNSKIFEALGSIQYELADYDKALDNFKKYLDYSIAANGIYSKRSATAYERIGKVLFEQKNYKGAIKNYTQAIEIEKEITDVQSGQGLAMAYLMRSMPYAELGQYARAEGDIHSAQKIYTNTLSDQSPILNKLWLIYAKCKLNQNQVDSAEYYVLRSIKQLLSKQKEQTEKYNSDLSNYSNYLPDAYRLQAKIVLKKSNDIAHKRMALYLLEKAVADLRGVQNLYTGETSILHHFNNNSAIYTQLEDLYYQLYVATGDSSYINSIFQLNEEHNSVLIRKHLNAFTSFRVANVPDSIIQSEHDLSTQLSDLNNVKKNDEAIIKMQTEYDKLRLLIKTEYPKYYTLRYNNDVASIKDLRKKLLKPGQNLIQYIIADSSSFAILVNTEQTKLLNLGSSDLEKEIGALNAAIVNLNQSGFERASKNLYRILFQPLEPFLNGQEIFIVPDGKLFSLNFEILIKPSTAVKPDYLINHYTISYLLSSTTALQYKNINHNAPGGILSFAPGFFNDTKAGYKAAVKDKSRLDSSYFNYIQQPFAVASALKITDIIPGRAFISEKATERNFKKEAANFRIIHLGTHTQINAVSPLLSRLVLSKEGGNESSDYDGYLHAYEIYNLSLRAELAVLTACETGAGKYISSEGVRSLAHSFAYAGCPSVVMSLWQIDEKTSSEIIEDFYQHLASGMPKNKALRAAKLKYTASHTGELMNPYYWSGIVLVGDVSPLSLTHQNPLWWFVLIAVFVLIIIGFFVPFREKTR